ncbi:hypothetical protein, partial [Dokdonella sp.]|uniref:hypothetical protein n=1 Tax=Dokdonella sp. TaxID=2291710 RepID=UPI003C422E25
FACLSFEVGLAAFNVVEAGVAASKLQWWAEELALLSSGTARHPLTQVLEDSIVLSALPAQAWQEWIGAAFAQREVAPARNLSELLTGVRAFHEPLARIKSALYPNLSVDAEAHAGALCHVVLESVRHGESSAAERLPIPLDLLARHGLSRTGMGSAGPERDAVLRDHFAELVQAMIGTDRVGLLPMTAASLTADLKRCRVAGRSANPLETVAGNLDRLPFSAVWACWIAARRVQPAR